MGAKQLKNRIDWVDIAKGIGIILVVLGHLSTKGQFFRTIIYSFHMPLFFIISGFLYRQKDFASSIKRGVKKLILPMLFFMAFDTVLTLILNQFGMFDPVNIKEVVKCFLLIGGTLKNSPIWFLLVLFLCNTLQYFISKNDKIAIAVLVITFIISLFSPFREERIYWYIAFFSCMFFFEFGYLFSKIKNNAKFNGNEKYKLNDYCLIVIVLIWAVTTYVNGIVDMIFVNYGRSFILLTLSGITGTYILVRFSKFIQKYKFSSVFKLFGQNSMLVLTTHFYLTKFIIHRIFKILNILSYQYKWYVEILLCALITLGYFVLFKLKSTIMKSFTKTETNAI